MQVQSTNKAAVDNSLPAFAGGCTIIQCIALQFRGASEDWVRQRGPVRPLPVVTICKHMTAYDCCPKKEQLDQGKADPFPCLLINTSNEANSKVHSDVAHVDAF